MSTADKLNKLLETKEAIRQAIISKGVEVPEDTPFADYAAKINEISGGSGSESGIPLYVEGMFNENKAEITEVNVMVTEEHTDLNGMFDGCENLTIINGINEWNTSNVENMGRMFGDCHSLTELDLSSFDTERVNNMERMFESCENLTIINGINEWNTSNVNNMECMFCLCNSLTELDLSNFNTSNVENMHNMFESCNNLTELNLSSFNTERVNNMENMFAGCENLATLNLSGFDMSNVENMNNMFERCEKLHTLRLDNCDNDTIRKIIESSEFPTDEIGETRKIYVKSDNIEGLMSPRNWIFIDCETGEKIGEEEEPEIYEPGWYEGNRDITEATTMVIADHDNLERMFANCENLIIINGIDEWDTSNVREMREMFVECKSLTELNLSSFNTSNVENMENMFAGCNNLTTLDLSSFNTERVENMERMFFECNNLTELDLSNFNTSNVENMGRMQGMFGGCERLHTLRLDNCNNDTIRKIIIESNEFPIGEVEVDGEWQRRKMYVNPDNIGDLEAPGGWVFVNKDTGEEI